MGIENNENSSKTILIVEDESIIALNLKYDLEDLGYNVIGIVDTGDDAIDNAVEHRPDLTIMDINLKGEINGIQAAKKILALDLAVIYLTANSDDITFNETLSTSPASAFIPKPYNIDALSKTIALAINRQSVESEKVNEARGIAKDKNKSEKDVLEIEGGETLAEILNRYSDRIDINPICARVNNRTESLSFAVFMPKQVEFIDASKASGNRAPPA